MVDFTPIRRAIANTFRVTKIKQQDFKVPFGLRSNALMVQAVRN